MPRAFRFEPPRPRDDLVTRPRLLQALLGRWNHRIVTVVGGAGLGKTTLLSQAVAENLLAPQGDDVWVGLESADSGRDSVARAVAFAVGAAGIEPTAVADALWRRSPTEVCVFLDDLHLIDGGSDGARWLQELVDALPANGHLVLASRAEPALRLARLRAQGEVVTVGEDNLRFSDDELARFASQRHVDPQRFEQTGGWPAMAELAASVERLARFDQGSEFLWEEVLEPLGPQRQRILAAVCDLGGADDELASAALGEAVDLSEALDGVPLVATGVEGWRAPHPLWRNVPGIGLPTEESNELRRRAVEALVDRRRFDEAFALLADAELWDQASDVLRSACVASDRPTAEQLDRWLATCPPAVRDTVGGRLAVAFLTTLRSPNRATGPLTEAAGAARVAGDPEGELAALAELGRVAWWSRDLGALAPIAGRVAELAKAGHPLARGLAGFGRAIAADVAGDELGALEALDRIPPGVLDPGWEASTRWLRAQLLLARGRPAESLAVLDGATVGDDPALRAVFGAVRASALWGLGRIDEVLAGVSDVPESDWAAGVSHNRRLGLFAACSMFASVGDIDAAQRCLDALGPDSLETASQESVAGALAVASVLLARGKEDRAAGVVADAVDRHGSGAELERRLWRGGLTTTYVFAPETRARWDAADLGPYHEMARGLAAAVVVARTGEGDLRDVELPDVALVRSALHFRFAADLAIGLTAVDRPEGEAILEALGTPGREAVRRVAGSKAATAKPAKALLVASPAPPAQPTYLGVLGPLVLRRGGPTGVVVGGPDLRRERLRELLAFLVSRRTTTRATLMATLWPDLDERSAANNLRVTFTYLLRLLEPVRASGEPSYLVRLDGARVQLVTGEYLVVDVDGFDDHVAAAAKAEEQGSPSAALEHHLAAVELYRGDLHTDVNETDWLLLDREHYRTRFVAAAVRAGELLVGRGETDEAEVVARRALEVDPWSEQAYAVLVAAALNRGDRSAASRRLDQCHAALAELGLDPSDAILQLARRTRGQ